MKGQSIKPVSLIIYLVLFLAVALYSQDRDTTIFAQINPVQIQVGTFFEGAEVEIMAETPECDAIIIKLEGKLHEMTLNMKGKKGFIWLNVKQVHVINAPRIYIMNSSKEIEKITKPEILREESIGYHALRKSIKFKSDKPLDEKVFDEFIRFKEDGGMYNIHQNIKIEKTATNGRQNISAVLPIPSIIPAEKYDVWLYCFKDGNVIAKTALNLSIELAGLPRLTIDLAFGNPAIYGVCAIVVALAAGLLMGLIFGKKSSGGH
jgi:uncharacterized protein (TIGR02186 family)